MPRSRNEHPVEYILRTGTHTEDGCLMPKQRPLTHGYVTVKVHDKPKYAHRLVWEYMNGPVPEGLEVCHDPVLCSSRACCAIEHLRVDTRSANALDRAITDTDAQASKTRCPAGHPYEGVNLYVRPDGSRVCRECKREVNRQWYARKKARS